MTNNGNETAKKNKNANSDLDSIIIPQRFIPFDMGIDIDDTANEKLSRYFNQKNYKICEIPPLLKSISADVVFKIELSVSLRLYLFSYGIGVFMLEDNLYHMSEKYAVDYCGYRKKAHKEILEFTHGEISKTIRTTISDLRLIVRNNKFVVRPSASDDWECGGLSYVMTVSYIIKKDKERKDYDKFSDIDKKNLQIMLQPSLAHEEDTMALAEFLTAETDFDPYNFDANQVDAPRNWIRSEDCAIYISWAAVVVYLHDLLGKYMEIIEYLEADLQAMWLYTYCQYINLKSWSQKEKLSSAKLKKEKYNFQRKYNEFISDNDSSVPVYISDIRNELINTSGINHEKDNYMEYIEFCIDETESYEGEQQRKYSIMNEVLLFIIAFIQIAPMLYNGMIGQYNDIQKWPIIIMSFFVVIAVIFIVRKD